MGAYFELGLRHITDLNGYDHILFLLALCAPYSLGHWKKVAILVTAFTVGHSLTLALAVLDIVQASAEWVEFIIPITILLTAIYNGAFGVIRNISPKSAAMPPNPQSRAIYGLTVCFGLIHGLGFSNYLRSLLGHDIVWPLLNFNIGLEIGQLAIVTAGLVLQWAIARIHAKAETWWPIALSAVAVMVALKLAFERFPGF